MKFVFLNAASNDRKDGQEYKGGEDLEGVRP
jgi:hypothetical protein